MLDASEYARWREAAVDALDAAAAQVEGGSYHWGCFLAEQAAQLATKGLLHGIGAGAWGHDLADLAERVGRSLAEDLPEAVREALLRLSRHYIATRYPDAHPASTPRAHYSSADAEQALVDARAVVRFVEDRWAALKAAAEAEQADEPG